ncbi:unnamed protein product [Ambrosiozyma monospora]|uniref:Unnamed protein product n=1 Tax=Ambrosiozyma monospora TaxID=43982 RepID=A0ACB5U484_AMBMO|nr:unnamed protein product [Ambrosiozyma monospora]
MELAVDMHCTAVISSSGYQRAIKWLWRGWIVQASTDASEYVLYKGNRNVEFAAHFDPDRIKTPLYQNIFEILFSFIYLGLYTYIINNDTGDYHLGLVEIVYYLFTLGFALDELTKFYHIGYNYLNLSNGFNCCLFALVISSAAVRFTALEQHDPDQNFKLNLVAFRLLSMAAPMMWIRLLLFLDVLQFVGAMVVLTVNVNSPLSLS